MPYMPLARFKEFARKHEAMPAGLVVRKQLVTTIEDISDRQVRFTISTGSVDRDNDTVAVDGWDLNAFIRNPVVLWAHRTDHLPIGKAIDIGPEGDALMATVEFVPADVPKVGDIAEAVLRLLRGGFLSATSVGFRPLEYDIATSREDENSWSMPMNFLRQELMEFSVVSVPANAEALIDPAERAAGPGLVDLVADQQLAAEAEARKVARDAHLRRHRIFEFATL